jgi:hypothetical protein
MGWGNYAGNAYELLYIDGSGVLNGTGGVNTAVGNTTMTDEKWHHVVNVSDNAAADGAKRKLYVDGIEIGQSLTLDSVTLVGAGGFRLFSYPAGAGGMAQQLHSAFVIPVALTAEQVRAVYNYSVQEMAPSPKDESSHIEAVELGRLLAIFDQIEASDKIDMAVMA